jgi:uncharacterized protein YecT (DUF1311 family)
MRASLLIAFLISATPSIAFAQQNCGDLTNQTDMNTCAGQAYSKADAELNAVYKQIEARLKDDADTKKLLVTAQKAWIGFRDAQCNFTSSEVTGSLYPFISYTCLYGQTLSRTQDLKVFLKCNDGDLDCPVPGAK